MAPIGRSELEDNLNPSVNELKLTINGKCYNLDCNVPHSTSLLHFIRSYAKLPGTKALCYEGGCGICSVVATAPDPETGGLKTFSVKSCQTMVYSCVGWSISTIEQLGDRYDGYSKLQNALHQHYGTQCGYCTPGFVMTMLGQLESSKDLTDDDIEKSLDGNLCRCTGYRPILDAFKTFASNAPQDKKTKLVDIEDSCSPTCSKTGTNCNGNCINGHISKSHVFRPTQNLVVERGGITWHRPTTIEEIYDTLEAVKPSSKVRFVVGHTGAGVYKNDGPFDTFIDTSGIPELYKVSLEPSRIILGANVSLKRCIQVFEEAASKMEEFAYLADIANHWKVVANVAIRNVGSWAGNMAMKRNHPGFCSDIFISLVAADARLTIGKSGDLEDILTPEEFLTSDMTNSIILSVEIPQQSKDIFFRSYKITPRAVNAHAYVNACFKFHVDSNEDMKVKRVPTIAFGGINSTMTRAFKTETFLIGRHLGSSDDVMEAISILGEELNPDANPEDSSPEFRRSLGQSLLYKAILALLEEKIPARIQSGGSVLKRPVSSSRQRFDANQDSWPVGQPMPKLESKYQISGEAEYLDDIPSIDNELFGVFVQSTIARGKIKSINASDCLKHPGVVDFIQASDIPGVNDFFVGPEPDPVFISTEVNYYQQSIGLVVAKTRAAAKEGSKLVRVEYTDVEKPILTIKEAMKQNSVKKLPDENDVTCGNVEVGFKNSRHVVEGEVEFGSQFHFTMEPLAARVVPIEDGYDVYCTSQWGTLTQNVIARNLGIPAHSINMSVRRIGGGFGGKISRQNIVASAAAVAAKKLKKPVRVSLDLATHMTLVGWREPYLAKYKIGFSEEGKFESICMDMYSDNGHVANECSSGFAIKAMPSVYHCPNWKLHAYTARTNTAANTWCRTPAHPEAIAALENIVERVAFYLGKDPLQIREMNFCDKENPQTFGERREDNLVKSTILPLFMKDADIVKRKQAVIEFNKENRWKKRGLSVIPLRYAFDPVPFFQYNVQVTIYEHDGSVAITHGGIEMGQGINTKVAQVAAKTLDIPIDLIKIKPFNLFTGANSLVTGGSRGSDLSPHGVKICCERIRKRMDGVAKKMDKENGEPKWGDLVKKCFAEQVEICERYMTIGNEHPGGYDIWGVACVDVEIDVLTGQFLIRRADIIEDCGRSMSPYVDMGQVEGAFIMGLGFYTSEKVKFNYETGQKLSNGTWEYKPPTALDIPVDFRVSFLPKSDNPEGVLGSKATGEPPFCLSYAIITAMREAILSARKDGGINEWFEIDTPLTVEKIHQLCGTPTKAFII